jgi:hypothetical protein
MRSSARCSPWPSGRTVARSGLRMMPTFLPSPLSFRTAGFPQYGWKVGFSGSAFPHVAQVKPAPGMSCATPKFATALRAPRCPTLRPALCRNNWTRWRTAIAATGSLSLRPVELLVPLADLTGVSPSQPGLLLPSFPTGRSPFPRSDITTVATAEQSPPMGLSPIGTSVSIAARSSSLRTLRQRIPAFVQSLRRYCTTVRLPINVHVGPLDHVLLQPALHNCMSSVDGTSRFSRVKFPCMLGVFDRAEPDQRSRFRIHRCCLPHNGTASAL